LGLKVVYKKYKQILEAVWIDGTTFAISNSYTDPYDKLSLVSIATTTATINVQANGIYAVRIVPSVYIESPRNEISIGSTVVPSSFAVIPVSVLAITPLLNLY